MMEIIIEDDFDLKKNADSGQCFRWEEMGENTYRIVHLEYCVTVKKISENTFQLSCDKLEFDNVWRNYFDLDENYRSIRHRINKSDQYLYNACKAGKGIRILRQDPWETLISFIISQNRNIPAIKRSIALLCEATGKIKTDYNNEQYYQFPTPDDILSLSDDSLNDCKLGYRCPYVRAAAAAVNQGSIRLDELLSENETDTIKALTAIHGVGPKVANCVSLFGLHHIDAFPIDVWIRRVLDQEYPDGYPMNEYSPYNGIYQQYMFYYSRMLSANGAL